MGRGLVISPSLPNTKSEALHQLTVELPTSSAG